MKITIFLFAILGLIFTNCSNNHDDKNHDKHEEIKIQFTAYSNEFELFAEADPFVVGKKSNILSHFSNLPDFKAMERGIMTIRLIVDGHETNQTLDKPTRKGIYSFDLTPDTQGNGQLLFDIITEDGKSQIIVNDIIVYATGDEAAESAQMAALSKTNTIVFTKEQSWKVDFATELPEIEPFGQVIKSIGQIQSAPGDEILVSAKTNGIVMFSSENVLEGKSVSKGQILFSVSGSGLSDNNSTVRFAEAKNNFEKAKSEYYRAKELANDKIVSDKELQNAKSQYENTKAVFDNLSNNFNTSGQNVSSPMNGFVKQLFVQNGQYLEIGQQIVSISKNKTLIIQTNVQQKYSSLLSNISSANIRTLYDNRIYTLRELNGKLVTYGKSTNNDNYLMPINFEIDNKGSFFSGGFVELYIKTITNLKALTIPSGALMEEQGSYFIFVQITPELFEKREVKIGASDGLKTEILSGISPEERVVTKGAILIKLAQSTGNLDAQSGHVH